AYQNHCSAPSAMSAWKLRVASVVAQTATGHQHPPEASTLRFFERDLALEGHRLGRLFRRSSPPGFDLDHVSPRLAVVTCSGFPLGGVARTSRTACASRRPSPKSRRDRGCDSACN